MSKWNPLPLPFYCYKTVLIKSWRLSTTISLWHHRSGLSLVQLMACCLFILKPLSRRRPRSCSLMLTMMSWRNSASAPVLSAVVVSAATLLSACSASCGSTRGAVASLEDWWPTQSMSAAGVMVRLGPSAADLWLKWVSMAPDLMWRPPSATWVTCCAPVGVVAVTLPPDVAWPG